MRIDELKAQRAALEREYDEKFGNQDWTYHDLTPEALERFTDLDEAITAERRRPGGLAPRF